MCWYPLYADKCLEEFESVLNFQERGIHIFFYKYIHSACASLNEKPSCAPGMACPQPALRLDLDHLAALRASQPDHHLLELQ